MWATSLFLWVTSPLQNKYGKLTWGKSSACIALSVCVYGELFQTPKIDAVHLTAWLAVVTASYSIHKYSASKGTPA